MTTAIEKPQADASGSRPDSGTALYHHGAEPNQTIDAPRVNEKDGQDHQPAPAPTPAEPDAPSKRRQGTLKQQYKGQKDKIKDKVKPPGGFDATPIPDAPPGYTVKFIFHRARNLPVSDYGTGSSDPFLTATLTTALRKRHKEDPDLVYRTRTIRKSLEPEWEQEWIVANVPATGFKLKCRLYDEDWPDSDDRLGNVTLLVDSISESGEGLPPLESEFDVKKRAGSKRAYLLRACTNFLVRDHSITPHFALSVVLLGPSDPPHGHMYTVGPTFYYKHFSPMIGRMTGIKVNRDEDHDHANNGSEHAGGSGEHDRETQKYDFQANTLQLAGPVPPKLYHRFVEFRPVIGMLFKNKGIRGKILNGALHHQHRRVYSFRRETEFGTFKACTEEASLQFLRMVHFDQGGRIFTYVITLDGVMRFTETGKEFGIDLLSKHTMHSDAAVYIACSGEFMVRRLEKPNSSEDPEPDQPTHPSGDVPGGPPKSPPPANPRHYQLIIDNDSGTYRPDKSVLPNLRAFLERNFPGIGIVTLDCDDPKLKKLKNEQFQTKKKEGRVVRMVANRSPSASSFSSDDVSDLDELDQAGDGGHQSKREKALDLLADPSKFKEYAGLHNKSGEASTSAAAEKPAEKPAQSGSASAPRP